MSIDEQVETPHNGLLDISTLKEMNISKLTQIAKELDVDSLHYLSVEKLMDSVPHTEGQAYCNACFTGEYPVKIDTEVTKLSTEE